MDGCDVTMLCQELMKNNFKNLHMRAGIYTCPRWWIYFFIRIRMHYTSILLMESIWVLRLWRKKCQICVWLASILWWAAYRDFFPYEISTGNVLLSFLLRSKYRGLFSNVGSSCANGIKNCGFFCVLKKKKNCLRRTKIECEKLGVVLGPFPCRHLSQPSAWNYCNLGRAVSDKGKQWLFLYLVSHWELISYSDSYSSSTLLLQSSFAERSLSLKQMWD